MIKSIEISNFYSFDSCVIHLHPETNILIGINGSGKSNFLKAIKLLREGVAGVGLRKHILDNLGGIDNFLYKGNSKDSNVQTSTIRYTFDGPKICKEDDGFNFTDDIIYEINIVKLPSLSNYYIQENIRNSRGFVYLDFDNGTGNLTEKLEDSNYKTRLIKYDSFDSQELVLKEINDPDRYYALTTLKKAIRDIVVYDYFDTTPKSAIRRPVLPTSEKRLASDGANLPQILNTIKINNKPYYRKIADMLNEVNVNFTGFDFNFIGGNIELMIEEDKLDSAVHVSNISDGTLRYLCLLAILYNPDRGRLICIDEPEVGLHPDMISSIANAVKEASESSTIIISTHSENFLNYFEIENVLVFEKNEDNATIVNTFTKEVFEGWYEKFAPGQMWRQGDLGGVRYGS